MGSIGFGTCEDGDGSVLDAIVKLLVADPAQCTRDGLELVVARVLRVRSWLDSIETAVAAQASRLAATGKSADAATVLGGGGRRSRRDAEAAADRGRVCQLMPVLGEAMAGGDITAGHVDAVAAAARSLDDAGKARLAKHAAVLAETAAASSPEEFARDVKDLARNLSGDGGLSHQERLRRERNVSRWVDKHTGMHKTLLSLDPLADAEVWTAINAAIAAACTENQRDDDRTWPQLQADVVVDLLTRGGGPGGDRAAPEVSVLIDLDTLVNGLGSGSVCETSDGVHLPVETLRRLCCDAEVIPIVLGGNSEALDVGRSCRVANRAQRRALRATYRTCAHPQCTIGFDACRIHHVTFWFHGGRSDLDNLIPLCEVHHHLVHEGGWTLTLHPDRRTTWHTPDGTVYHDGITIDRLPDPTSQEGRQPNDCRRQPRRRPPTTAAEVADDLLGALTHARASATAHAGGNGRGPPT